MRSVSAASKESSVDDATSLASHSHTRSGAASPSSEGKPLGAIVAEADV